MEETNKKSKKNDKSAKSFKPEANIAINQFNTNTNVFSQLSAQFLSSKKEFQEDQQVSQFIQKTQKKKEVSFAQYDGEMQQILNSLNKKSEITKKKALDQLQNYLSKKEQEYFNEFIGTWSYMYKQLVTSEHDRKILEDINRVLLLIVEKNKKCIQKNFKEVFPYWFLCMNDIHNKEIQKVAQKAFLTCFPQEKHNQVLNFGLEQLVKTIQIQLNQTPEMINKENINLNTFQSQEICDRLTICALLSIKNVIQIALNHESKQQEKQQNLSQNNLVKEMTQIIFDTKDPKDNILLIKILEEQKRYRVKAAVIDAFTEMFSCYTEQEIQNNFNQNLLFKFTSNIFTLMGEKERLIQLSLWNGQILIKLLQNVKSDLFQRCDQNMIQHKTVEMIRTCASGIGQIFYKNLIVFISHLPNASFIPKKQDTIQIEDLKENQITKKLQFLQQIFEAFYQSRENEELKFFNQEFIQSYFECIYFITLKRIYPVYKCNKFQNLRKQFTNFLNNTTFSMVQYYISQNYEGKMMQNLFKLVPSAFSNLLQNLSIQDFQDKDNEDCVGQQFVTQFIQEGMQKIAQQLLTSKISNPEEKRKFQNIILILDHIIQNLNQQSFVFEQLNTILLQIHNELLQKINLKTLQQVNNEVLEQQMEFILKYKEISTILGKNQQKPLVKNILENELQVTFTQITENLQILCQNIKKFTTNYSQLEQITHHLLQILYSWYGDSQKVIPIFKQIFTFLQTQIYEKIDFNMPAVYPLIVMGFHILQPTLKQNHFHQSSQQISKINKNDEINSMKNYIKLFEREHKNIQTQYAKQIHNFQEYQDFASFFIIKAYKQIQQNSKQVLPSIINILLSYLTQEKQSQVLKEIQEIASNLKVEMIEKDLKNYHSIEKVEHSMLIASSYNKTVPDQNMEITTKFYENIVQVIFYLYQNRMKTKSQHYFQALALGIKSNQEALQLFNNSTNFIIQQQMELIFVKEQDQDEITDKLDKLIQFNQDLIEFLKSNRKIQEIENLILQILNEKYFKNILFNKEIWRLLQNLFQKAIITLDFNKFIQNLFLNNSYNWLFINLISSSQCQAIIDSIPLRNYFRNLSMNFITPMIYETIEKENTQQNFLDFIQFLNNQCITTSLTYLKSLKVIIKQINVEKMNEKVIQTLFNNLVEQPVKHIFESKETQIQIINQALVIKDIFSLFTNSIQEEQQNAIITFLEDNLSSNIESKNQEKSLDTNIILDLLTNLQDCTFLMQNQKTILEYLIEPIDAILKSNTENEKVPKNFQISVLFEFVNFIIEKFTIEELKDQIKLIEKLLRHTLEFNKTIQQFSSLVMIRCLQFIRKIIPIIDKFTPDFKNYIVKNIIDICNIKFNKHDNENDDNQQQLQQSKNEFIDQEIIEFAETITRFSLIMDSTFDENTTISLMNCKYPAIQKACFIVLDQFYQAFIPDIPKIKVDINDENYEQNLINQIVNPKLKIENLLFFLDVSCLITDEDIKKQKQLLKQKKQQQQDNTNPLLEMEEEDEQQKEVVEPKIYSYMMTWISFINKLSSNLENDNYTIVKRVLQIYLEEHKPLYQNFLTVLFTCINSLGFNEQEFKQIIKPEEVSKVSTEWSDFLSKESLFKLLIQALYVFCTKFPSYLRQWVDDSSDQKYVKIAETLIKTFISQAVYTNEVEIIEMSQHEWQTEEFNIYPYKNTREIVAKFEKESQTLQINLQVPPEYPLKPIQTNIDKGVKINQHKINKWMLRMKSLLMNQNGNIKSILVTWKNNLDKEFEGLEECPICYYIIHSTTKQLPKLSCKTCKYKFHNVCIQKWFQSSNKSDCPMCKSQFL